MTPSGKLDFLIYLALFFVAMASVARVLPVAGALHRSPGSRFLAG